MDQILGPETMGTIMACLQDPSEEVTREAIQFLRRFDCYTPEVEAAFLECLRSRSTMDPATLGMVRQRVEAFDTFAYWFCREYMIIESLERSHKRSPAIESLAIELLGDPHEKAQLLGLRLVGQLRLASPALSRALHLRLQSESNEAHRQEIRRLIDPTSEASPAPVQRDQLTHPDLDRRLFTTRNMLLETPGDAEALAVLMASLGSVDRWERFAAVDLLEGGLLDLPPLRTALFRASRDEEGDVRRAALSKICEVQVSGDDAIAALRQELHDPDLNLRFMAAQALVERDLIDQAVIDALVSCLDADYDHTFEGAASILDQLGDRFPDGVVRAVDRLLEQDLEGLAGGAGLDLLHVDLVGAGGRAWGSLDSDLALSALLLRARDADPRLRLAAMRVFADTGWGEPQVDDVIRERLDDPEGDVRAVAVLALGQDHPLSEESIGLLVQLLEDEDVTVRSAVTETLGTAPGGHLEVTDALLRCLEDPAIEVRTRAIRSLAGRPLDDPLIIPVLQAHLTRDPAVALVISAALVKLGAADPTTIGILLASVSEGGPYPPSGTADALAHLSTTSPDVAASLLEHLTDGNEQVARVVSHALVSLSRTIPDLLPTLLAQLKYADPATRRWLCFAFANTDAPPTPVVLGALHERVRSDSEPKVRAAAIGALAGIAGREKQRRWIEAREREAEETGA